MEIDLFGRSVVTGSLSPRFSELPDLQVLDLRLAQVSGDIEALQNLTKLEWLDLAKTKVSGDIEALQNLTELQKLDLAKTKVSGDIEALQNLTELQKLDLAKTKVSGDIEALQNLPKLKSLGLTSTNVIGDMSSLRSPSLENFDIEGTKITCEDAALRAVLQSLGLQAEQLTDLKNFEGVTRMLSCRNVRFSDWFFAHDLVD